MKSLDAARKALVSHSIIIPAATSRMVPTMPAWAVTISPALAAAVELVPAAEDEAEDAAFALLEPT